jgi:hypothetical protein
MHIICCPVMTVLREVLLFWYLTEGADSSPLDVMNEGNISFIIKPTRCTDFQIFGNSVNKSKFYSGRN